MAEFSNVIADNQNDIVHILENASHFNDADSGYRHVRVRDIQKNTDVSACNVKGKVLQSIVPRQIHVEDNGYRDTNPVNWKKEGVKSGIATPTSAEGASL